MDLSFLQEKADSKTIPKLRREPRPAEEPMVEEPLPPQPEPELAEVIEVLPADDGCPKCGGRLADPNNLGWCMKCGYCRSTDDKSSPLPVRAAPDLSAPKPSPLGMVELFQYARSIPLWFYVWLWGIIAVVFVAYLGDMQTANLSRGRALWCTTEIALGLSAMIVAQLWAAILVAPIDDKIGMRDAIVPFHLWAVSIKRLPLTSIPICIASWGLAAVLSGPIVVGGLDYWLPKQKTEKKIEIMDQEDVAKKLMESR